MAVSKKADIQELLPRVHKLLEDAIASPKYEKILALAEQVDMEDKWEGSRNMTKYFGMEVLPEGAYGPITESTPTLHSARAGDAIEINMSPVLMAGTLGWSHDQKKQAESADSEHAVLKIGKRMLNFARRIRKVNAKIFLGRGDGVIARANAAASNTTTFAAAANGPFFPTRGMHLKGYKLEAGGTNSERLKAQSDTGTSYVGDTITQVKGIRPEATNPTITLSVAAAWSDDTLLVLADGSTATFPNGIQNHLDAPTGDSSMVWDAEDGTTCDHTDIYLGGTRSAQPDLECQTYDVSAAISTEVVAKAVAICEAQGAEVDDLVMLINPIKQRALQDTFQGGVRYDTKTVHLAAAAVKNVKVLTGEGYGDLKVIPDYGIPRDKFVLLDTKRLKQFRTKIEWFENGKLYLQPSGSTGHNAVWLSYLSLYWNSGLFAPLSSLVAYSLS
jgi:hypothetical protein